VPFSRQGPAFSGLMDALGSGGSRSGNLDAAATLPWAHRQAALGPASQWPATATAGNAPLFGMSHIQARWRFVAHRKLLEATEKMMCSRQALHSESVAAPPVPLFQ
jgi:hypothetical protein